MSFLSNDPNDVRGPGVVAVTGDLMVSSDHRLCCGGEAVEVDVEPSLSLVFGAAVEPDDNMRNGIRHVPEKELTLSFRLLIEPDMLSLRSR